MTTPDPVPAADEPAPDAPAPAGPPDDLVAYWVLQRARQVRVHQRNPRHPTQAYCGFRLARPAFRPARLDEIADAPRCPQCVDARRQAGGR